MPNNPYTVKNPQLAAIIERLLQQEPGESTDAGKSTQELGENLVGAFALDMLKNGQSTDPVLDASYATLGSLQQAVALCYRGYRKSNNVSASVEATAQSLAAYFFALAMNEHGCAWEVSRMPVLLHSSTTAAKSLWGVLRIRTGLTEKPDFLTPVRAGCFAASRDKKRLAVFDLAPLRKAYRGAVGVDLREYGLRQLILEV